jgi:hypothetical protein
LFGGLLVVVWWVSLVPESRQSATSLQVLEVRGDVTLIRQGDAARLEAYTKLLEGDRVQTMENSEVAFVLPDEATFRLRARSALQVVAVQADALTLSLDDGLLEATVRSQRPVRVEGGGRVVRLTDGDARFGRQSGVFQVEATEGTLEVEGEGGGLVQTGQQAVLTDRFAQIGDVPASLLLEVDWPEPDPTRQRQTTVYGRTAPGARVTVGGVWGQVEVFANQEGRFEAQIPLGEGDNEVEFSSLDPLGRVSEVYRGRLPVRDTTGPRVRGAVEYDR